jgi:hypothetical protein
MRASGRIGEHCGWRYAGVRAFSDAAMRTSWSHCSIDRDGIGIAGKEAGECVGDLTVVDSPEPLIGEVLEPWHEVDIASTLYRQGA